MKRTLAILSVLCFASTLVHAQTNLEYSFRQQMVADGMGHNNNGDPAPYLSMDCLAANGTGQWTLTSYYAHPGWWLLGNGLYAPSIEYDPSDTFHHPGCIPPGTVEFGPDPSGMCGTDIPAGPKAAANLIGWNYFIWPDDYMTGLFKAFTIDEFGPTDINISLHGIPNPDTTRNIINSAIHVYTVNTGSDTALLHDVLQEADFRNRFDAAEDGSFRYITWTSNVNSMIPGDSDIWVDAVHLGTNIAAPGFPRFAGRGIRPTVACNVRNTGRPKFDVAFITSYPGGAIVSQTWDDTIVTTNGLDAVYFNPVTGTAINFTNPSEVRALVSSVPYHTPTHAMYAIVSEGGAKQLIMYKPITLGSVHDTAAFVDGTHATYYPTPVPIPLITTYPVVDAPIIAFANPYDNQSGTYDQFHCLYQLDAQYLDSGGHTIHVHPLMIVRGSCNGALYPPPDTIETRLVLNQTGPLDSLILLPDPDRYVAAINQMGIHVHWKNGSLHYYSRDMNRTFDEDIEENTLVTDTCIIADGQRHGGTTGAQLLDGRRITIWTDPIYGHIDSNVNAGLYQPRTTALPYVSTLSFQGALDPIRLHVSSSDVTNPAVLAVTPLFSFLLSGVSDGVTIGPGGIFDYYGLRAIHAPSGTISSVMTPFSDGGIPDGDGSIKLQGGYSTLYGLPFWTGGVLNVHGGANFYIGEDGLFSDTSGFVNILNEPNIYPVNSSGALNDSSSGVMTFEGQASFDSAVVTGHFTTHDNFGSSPRNYMIHVLPSLADVSDSVPADPQYTSVNTLYTNVPDSGLAQIRFDGAHKFLDGFGHLQPSYYGGVSFSRDSLHSVEITAVDPQENFTVANSAFDGANDMAIKIQRTALTSYGQITITNDTFYTLGHYGTANALLSQFSGENLAHVTVSDNVLASTRTGYPVGINFYATGGVIEGNSLQGGFYPGIADTGAGDVGSILPDNTLICGNTLKHTDPACGIGISTANYQGYLKLNQIDSMSVGLVHSTGGTAKMLFSNIFKCGTGIELYNPGVLDMSGVHHSDTNSDTRDYPAQNSVHDNGGQISLFGDTSAVAAKLYLTQSPTSHWTASGENNIFLGSFGSGALVHSDLATTPFDISNNFWGVDPRDTTIHSTYWPNFNFSLDGGSPFPDSMGSASTFSGVSCGTSGTLMAKKGQQPLKILVFDTCHSIPDVCESLTNDGFCDVAYDTIRWYVDNCYQQADAERTWTSDVPGTRCASAFKTDAGKLDYRKWLLAAISLRSDDEWYCYSVANLGASLNDTFGMRGSLALLKFLIDNPRCASLRSHFGAEYSSIRYHQILLWQDTAQDNNMKYFDSTLPSLHIMGLDTLLKIAAGVRYEAASSGILGDVHVTVNPFADQTSISLQVEREAYVSIEVFDLLGNRLDHAGYEGVFEQGTRVIPLGLTTKPLGTYYVRVSTANNEVRTLKLVKE